MQPSQTPRIIAKPAIHRNKPVLRLFFPYKDEIIEKVRSIPGVTWSNSMRCWYVQDTTKSLASLHKLEGLTFVIENQQSMKESKSGDNEKREKLIIIRYHKGRIRLVFSYNAKLIGLIKTLPFYYYDAEAQWWTLPHMENVLEILKGYCKDNDLILEYFDEWTDRKVASRKKESGYDQIQCPPEFGNKLKILRYSENTIRNYSSALKEFIAYYNSRQLNTIVQKDIEKFLLYLSDERKVSASYMVISISALKFYFDKVLEMGFITNNLKYPRGERILPEVMSEDEIVRLFQSIENFKHKCILMTTYSGGLRLSEVVNLRLSDIDSRRMMIFIKGAKGRKDRYTLLSKELLDLLRKYYKNEKPKEWLFEGALGGRYSTRSVQSIMKEAVKRAGIKKHATVHTLRHSFATHMLEDNTDLRYIQSLLGHYSTKTTEIYTHITTKGLEQLRSPLDKLASKLKNKGKIK